MANKGYVSIHRSIQENFLWNSDESFSKGQAWIDLILMANHDTRKVMLGGQMITVKKGQMITSVRKLSAKWKWGKDKTLKFLRLLEEENMLKRDTQTLNGTLLTIVNYGNYQHKADTKRDTNKDTDKDTNKDTDKPQTIMKNNVNNVNNIEAAPVVEKTWEELNQEEWDD